MRQHSSLFTPPDNFIHRWLKLTRHATPATLLASQLPQLRAFSYQVIKAK
jgi:hypothetical protein